MAFTQRDVPRLGGLRAIVTGATGGLGLETARVLAGAGAAVIVAGRNPAKGAFAVDRIRRLVPDAAVRFGSLDMASLASIRSFSADMKARGQAVDIVINNAGLMAPPRRILSEDGFELQFGTNHLGHFALIGQLLPLLAKASRPRVVAISSGIAAFGRIDFEDLQSARTYVPNTAYTQSKLANLLFVRELQRRSDEHGWNVTAVAAHPGHARTELITNGAGRPVGLKALLVRILQAVASHDAAAGALPGLLAATGADVRKLDYYGPTGLLQQSGPPGLVAWPARAQDDAVARRLWDVSAALTLVDYS